MVAFPLRRLDPPHESRYTSASALDERSDARECERIVRLHARTFTLASHFLPPEKRRAAFALYAFCRVADDLVDQAELASRTTIERQLLDYERSLHAALAGRPSGPVFRELAWAVRHYDVPSAVLDELLTGVGRDLRPVRYESWPELGEYCEGVASTVGEMCTFVFGVIGGGATRERALRFARALGVAMQLTNVLRDVGEDARRGRCYLPEDELERFGLSSGEILCAGPALGADPRWHAMMDFQIQRARALYALAEPGISLLAPDAQPCAYACASGYAAILGAIEANGYDTITVRARVGRVARASLLWDVWRSARRGPRPPVGGDGPAVAWATAGGDLSCLTRTLA